MPVKNVNNRYKWTCCGQNLTTPFCPQCGTAGVKIDPLGELFLYVDRQCKVFQSRIETCKKHPCMELSPAIQRALDKWEAWRDALKPYI